MGKIIKSIKNRGFFRTIKLCIGTILYKIFRFIIYDNVLKNNKINTNLIVFDSFPDFSDNSLYLYEKYSQKNKYKFVWLVSKNEFMNSENTIFIRRESKLHIGPSLKALYYCSIASKIFYTHGSPTGNSLIKKEQIVINLWHGCGYKKDNSSTKKFLENNYFDYVLVPGNVFIDTKSKFFGCNKNKILTIGYPRYDLLFSNDKNVENFIHEVCNNNKVLLWMPTFRKTASFDYPEENIGVNYDLPLLDSTEDLKRLDEMCSKQNITLIIKRHPYQLAYSAENEKFSNIIFIDNQYLNNANIELYSLLKYTSALITDYSSVAIDYLLINKPIAFLLSDFEDYNKTRGFVFENPLEYMPGHHVYNKEDLFEFFKDIASNKDQYKGNREKIFNELHNKCDNYCERIIEKVDELYHKKKRGEKNEKI